MIHGYEFFIVSTPVRPGAKQKCCNVADKVTLFCRYAYQVDADVPGRWCPVPAAAPCLCRYQSGQALFSPLKLRSEGLVPASAAPCADADFHSHLTATPFSSLRLGIASKLALLSLAASVVPPGETLRLPVRRATRKPKRLSKANARQHTRLPHHRISGQPHSAVQHSWPAQYVWV